MRIAYWELGDLCDCVYGCSADLAAVDGHHFLELHDDFGDSKVAKGVVFSELMKMPEPYKDMSLV